MPTLQLKPHLTVEQLKERMNQQGQLYHFKRRQIVHAVATHSGITAQIVASLLGSSTAVVHRTVQLYNKQGAAFLEQRTWGGRREKRCLMSWEEEQKLLQRWEATALEGGILVAKQLGKSVETKIGHKVSADYLWDMLHRHGWTKKVPRPQHPKAAEGKEKTEAFKKKYLHSLNKQQEQNR